MNAGSDRDTKLVAYYASQIAQFKAFCLANSGSDGAFEELDWYDLSVGFFIALGITGDTSDDPDPEPFSDAFGLARICRYQFQYWC